MEDSACVLGLQKKDHPRPLNATTLDNLQTKQLAYALSGVTERLSASDILEAGGELASCLGLCCCHMPAGLDCGLAGHDMRARAVIGIKPHALL